MCQVDYENYWKSENVELANIKGDIDVSRIKELNKYAKKGKLLDIGCGQAHFAAMAKRFGWTVKTIDPSNIAKKQCEKFGIEMIEFAQIKQYGPEVVTLWHVIEHFENPLEYLEKLFLELSHGTLLILETPNKNSWNAKKNWNKWWYNQPEHLFYFNPSIMKEILKKAGFKTISIKPVGGFMVNQQQQVVNKIDKYYYIFKPLKKMYYLFSQIFNLSDCIRVVAVKE